uniref:Uncharacterized protein n=1 Tax=Rhizophora mucronata TaxID=61149 RepID=A0A2P2PA39_RHIMU
MFRSVHKDFIFFLLLLFLFFFRSKKNWD